LTAIPKKIAQKDISMPYVLHTSDAKCHDLPSFELKIAMQRKGILQKDLADQLSVSRQAVHLVVNNQATSHRIRKAIADAIGLDLKRIWPSTYLVNGGPIKPGRPSV